MQETGDGTQEKEDRRLIKEAGTGVSGEQSIDY